MIKKYKLFNENIKLVNWYFFNKVLPRYSKDIIKYYKDDIKQVLRLGLWKACNTWNKKTKFAYWASIKMRGEITIFFRKILKNIKNEVPAWKNNYNVKENI